MKLVIPFASAVLFMAALATPAYAMPLSHQKTDLITSPNVDVQSARWTGHHGRGGHYGWGRGRHYGWTRGHHYGWRYTRHRWR